MSLCLIDVHGDIEGDFEWVVDLPRNATNGDMIKALFPNYYDIDLVEEYPSGNIYFNQDWWNAPYKENK